VQETSKTIFLSLAKYKMARVGVLFPDNKRSGYNQSVWPLERKITLADQNRDNSLSILGRPTKYAEILDDDTKWRMYLQKQRPIPEGELAFKQPQIIRIPRREIRQEKPVIPLANDILAKQFLADRKNTRGMLNARQLSAMDLIAQQAVREDRIPETLSFDQIPQTVEGTRSAARQSNLFNTRFETVQTGRSRN